VRICKCANDKLKMCIEAHLHICIFAHLHIYEAIICALGLPAIAFTCAAIDGAS
jgi:hypothetical protein